jgi:hypothetical protein
MHMTISILCYFLLSHPNSIDGKFIKHEIEVDKKVSGEKEKLPSG